MKKTCLLLLAALSIAGCSHYTTNSKDIRFESVNLHIRPAIPVGGDEHPNEKFSYLGWVDAYVQKPSSLQPDPTEAQVNYVLAHLAKERGADAVVHVTYKNSIGITGLTRLEARGQAIRLDKPEAKAGTQFTPLRVTTVTPLSEQKSLGEKLNELSAPLPPIVPTEANPAPVAADSPIEVLHHDEQPIIADERPVFNHLDQPAKKKERPAPIGSASIAKVTPEAEYFSYTASRRDKMAEQRERVDLMLNNARFLENKAKESGDRDALNASLRLIQMLESQKRFFIEQENAQ